MNIQTKKQLWKGTSIMTIGFLGLFIPLIPSVILIAYGFYVLQEALNKRGEYI